jgi:hypothetical protein
MKRSLIVLSVCLLSAGCVSKGLIQHEADIIGKDAEVMLNPANCGNGQPLCKEDKQRVVSVKW